MRTKKYHKAKRSRYTKRRRTGGGWWSNIFKSKSEKEAIAAQATQAIQAKQLEAERTQKIAARPIAETAEKNIIEKQWQKENEEGWETPEELQNKIKQFSSAELAKRANNQKAINAFLQKEITAIQNDLGTCYPNGKTVIQKAKLKDLQDELYTLKEQEKNLRLERKVLKNMFKATPDCKKQQKLAKEKWQLAHTGDDYTPEPEEVFYDMEETALPASAAELASAQDTVQASAVQQASAALANAVDEEDAEEINAEDYTPPPQKTTATCDASYYTLDELNVCKVYTTIKKIIVQLIDSGNCKEIYTQPEKFYELVKKQVLESLLQGNWLAVRAKMGAITIFLKAYPGIKQTVMRTLSETRVFKALCESVLENPTIDINAVAETFTNQLINSIIDNLITEYKNNQKFSENIQWLQSVYYNYFDKKMMSQYSMGGKRKKVNVIKVNGIKVNGRKSRKKVSSKRRSIKRKTRRYK